MTVPVLYCPNVWAVSETEAFGHALVCEAIYWFICPQGTVCWPWQILLNSFLWAVYGKCTSYQTSHLHETNVRGGAEVWCVCVCVCMRERAREKERERKRERGTVMLSFWFPLITLLDSEAGLLMATVQHFNSIALRKAIERKYSKWFNHFPVLCQGLITTDIR